MSPFGWLLVVATVVVVITLSLVPVPKLPGDAGNYGGHLLAYGAAMVVVAGLAGLPPWLAACSLGCLGVAIELIQPSVAREAHWQDALANGLGIGVGWMLVRVWARVRLRRRLLAPRLADRREW